MSGLWRRLRGLRLRPGEIALGAALLGLLAAPRAPPVVPAGLIARVGHVTSLGVTVAETPRAERFGRWRVMARSRDATVLLRGRGPAPDWRAGQRLVARGVLRRPSAHEGWLAARGVPLVLQADAVRLGGFRGGLPGALDAVRARAQRALDRGAGPAEAALLRGMVLGDDARLGIADRTALRRAGLGHLVAASGANIALLATLALAVCAVVAVPRTPRLVVVLGLIALYVPLAGAGPSIRRAGIMGGAATVAGLASRPVARRYALLLAAVATLVLDPRAGLDPGWRLSFAAVAAIAALAAPLRRALVARGVPGRVAEAGAVTVAATVGTAPVAAAAFGTVSLASLPANLLAATLVAPATWLGMLAAVAGQVDPAAGAPLAALAALPAGLILALGRWCAGWPAAQIHATWWGVATALAVAAGAATLAARGRCAAAVALLLTGAVAMWAVQRPGGGLAPPPPGTARFSFLDVGQGDATLVQAGGHALLVDSGPPDGGVVRRLREAGVGRLDVLVATHAQADHDGGAGAVLGAVPVGLMLDGRDGVREPQGARMAETARARGVRLMAPRAGDTLALGPIAVRVLWPPAGRPAPGADPNARAIVLLVRAGGAALLLTADAESDVLGGLMLPPVDVLKVSHHGSADAGLAALLPRLRPRLAVIEVGRGNTYGHPAPSTVGTFWAAGVPVLRTDRDGTVRVEARGGVLRVRAGP